MKAVIKILKAGKFDESDIQFMKRVVVALLERGCSASVKLKVKKRLNHLKIIKDDPGNPIQSNQADKIRP